MATFLATAQRIVSELRRSNLLAEAKNAINDAITEGAKTRFYFNEMRGLTFPTVVGQEYYADQGIVEIDAMYYLLNGTRYNMWDVNNLYVDWEAEGSQTSSQIYTYSRQGTDIRIYPLPNAVVTVSMDGYGKLTPNPLTADGDTNAWLTYGERYIRQLAKAIMFREVIRDYGEATIADAMAEDLKEQLLGETTVRQTTDTLRSTQF